MNINEFNELSDSTRVIFHSTLEYIYTTHVDDGTAVSHNARHHFADFLVWYFEEFYNNGDDADLFDFKTFIVDFAKDLFTSNGDDVNQAFCDNVNDHISTMAMERGFNPDHYVLDDELYTAL